MSDAGGRWVEVPQPNGSVRRDWRPDEQPASPDGGPGDWHVITGSGGPDRWEWISNPSPFNSAPPTSPPPPSQFVGAAQLSAGYLRQSDVLTAEPKAEKQRGPGFGSLPKPVLIGAGAVAALVIGAVAVMGLTGGGSSGGSEVDAVGLATARDSLEQTLKSSIGVQFSQFVIGIDANGAPAGSMQVQFTNNGQEQQSFEAIVEAVGAQGGAPVAVETVRVAQLPAGQSVVQSVFVNVPADKLDSMTGASPQVTKYQGLQAIPES